MDNDIAGYGWYIKRIDNALEREANANLQALNLTMQQNRVLVHLAHASEHTMTLKELEAHFSTAQSTVAGLVSRLEKKGLVEALPNPSDRRVKQVHLTEQGLLLCEQSRRDIIRSEAKLTAQLSEEEKALLLVALRKIWATLSDSPNEQKG